MNLLQTFGILLLGVGLGALLTWLQQATVRRRFQQEIVAQIDKTLFDESRRQRFPNLKENLSGPDALHVPVRYIFRGSNGIHHNFPRDDPHIQLAVEWIASPAERKDGHEGLAAN